MDDVGILRGQARAPSNTLTFIRTGFGRACHGILRRRLGRATKYRRPAGRVGFARDTEGRDEKFLMTATPNIPACLRHPFPKTAFRKKGSFQFVQLPVQQIASDPDQPNKHIGGNHGILVFDAALNVA
jgi:hypothetical protein